MSDTFTREYVKQQRKQNRAIVRNFVLRMAWQVLLFILFIGFIYKVFVTPSDDYAQLTYWTVMAMYTTYIGRK